MAAHGDLNAISFFWKDGGNKELANARDALKYINEMKKFSGTHDMKNFDYVHNLVSDQISGILEELRVLQTWVVAYKVDIHNGSVIWNGVSWTPDIDDNGFPTLMTKKIRQELKKFAVERLHQNPRFLAVPAIYIKEENLHENIYTYQWIMQCLKSEKLQSNFDYYENSYKISPFEWFRATECAIRQQVYKVGFLRNEKKTITMVNYLPINSLEYQSDPITYANTFQGFTYSNKVERKIKKVVKAKSNSKLTLSSSSSEQESTQSSTSTSESTSYTSSPNSSHSRKMYMNLERCTSISQLFIGAFVNRMFGGKSSDSNVEHSETRKALKAYSQFKVDHYSDKGTYPHIDNDSSVEYMHYWLEQHSNEYTLSTKKSPFVNADCACDYNQKNTCQKQTPTEWNGHHITHPYKRFISLYVHFNGNSTNYSENVPLNTTEVFRDAVSCWREKTHVVINGKSQKWKPTCDNVDSWFGINDDNNSSIDPEDYEYMEDVD